MGSRLRLLVSSSDPGEASVDQAWESTKRAFEAVDAAMSRFRPDSELTRLNLGGRRPAIVSALLSNAIVLAERARRMTDGRFDPRVLGNLERLGFDAVPQAWPSGHQGGEPVVRRSGRTRSDRRGRITLSGAVDLGGLGKGLALRHAARAVGGILGQGSFLIDAGGDLATGGNHEWSIAIEDPNGGTEPVATIVAQRDTAVATSSTRIARHGSGSRAVHHLIDPSTGEPGGPGIAAVTVATNDPAWAEIWSKALFLGGAQRIGTEARGRGLAAWWVAIDGTLSMTPAARQQTTWVRSEAG